MGTSIIIEKDKIAIYITEENGMHKSCFECNRNQMKKISRILNLDKKVETSIINLVEQYQKSCDMRKSNPEIMGEIWKLITPVIQNDDPYRKIKSYFNRKVSGCVSGCRPDHL